MGPTRRNDMFFQEANTCPIQKPIHEKIFNKTIFLRFPETKKLKPHAGIEAIMHPNIIEANVIDHSPRLIRD